MFLKCWCFALVGAILAQISLVPSAFAGDIRTMEIRGLQAGASVEQVQAHYPLTMKTIYSEPEFPSLGVYVFRGTAQGQIAVGESSIAISLRADFDRDQKLFSYHYVEEATSEELLNPRLQMILDRYGAADRTAQSNLGITHDYILPRRDGNVGPEVRLRLILEKAWMKVEGRRIQGARLTVNFIDYLVDEKNYADAYYGAVIAERDRVSEGEYIHEEIWGPAQHNF